MANRDNTKERILAMERIFLRKKPLNVPQIIDKLDREYDIQVERKTVYNDIAVLTMFLNICEFGVGRNHVYQLVDTEE